VSRFPGPGLESERLLRSQLDCRELWIGFCGGWDAVSTRAILTDTSKNKERKKEVTVPRKEDAKLVQNAKRAKNRRVEAEAGELQEVDSKHDE
jgi:hypothetical protein